MREDEETTGLAADADGEIPATDGAPSVQPKPKKPRGFACISPERRSEIARKGGMAAHAAGTAHRFTSEEGKAAGTKGGNAPHVSRGLQKKGIHGS